MFKYKNCSGSTKQYYGVIFHPSDVHTVPASISDPKFVLTDEPETSEKTSTVNTSTVKAETTQPENTETQFTPQPLIPEQEEVKRSRRSKGE